MSSSVFAQDPHLSMFYSAPLQLNPALTGVFNGNYRVSALYRSQWGELLKNEGGENGGTGEFRTMTFAADFRIPVGKNALGIGVEALNDKSAISNFGTTRAGVAVSYMQSLDRWSQHYLVAGIQGDLINRTFNPLELRLGEQWTGSDYDPTTGQRDPYLDAASTSRLFYDISAGLLYFFKGRDDKFTAYAGFSVQHINEPSESFVGDASVKLPMKYSGHAGINIPILPQIHILPKLLVQSQGQSLETMYGTDVRFLFDKFDPSGNAFRFGAMFRGVGGLTAKNVQGYNAESMIFMAGVDFKGIDLGVAYDLTISSLKEGNQSRGGFEVSLIYVGKWSKRSRDVTACPKF